MFLILGCDSAEEKAMKEEYRNAFIGSCGLHSSMIATATADFKKHDNYDATQKEKCTCGADTI